MALQKRKRKTKIIWVILALFMIAFMIQQKDFISNALFDTSQAVQIDPDQIENSTLIIGTHLIYLHALNDSLYTIAEQSASDSGQDRIYYKSEMADGLWYDITDAGSIKDISTDGDIVEKAVLQQLYFTHHTKSDGITYDLRQNKAVSIFDIYPLYDLENMPELESLKIQYDMMKDSKSETDTSGRNLSLSRQFFQTEIETEETKQYGQQMDALQGYYEELTANEASITETESVLNIMEKVDYARKATVFSIVDTALSSLQDKVADTRTPRKSSKKYELDDALLTAIGNSQSALHESMTEAQGNMLSDGESILTHMEFTLSQSLIAAAESENYASCDEINGKLIDLKHINEGIVVNRNTELTLIEEMLSAADQKYQEKLSQGENGAYQNKKTENASHATLNNIRKQDMSEVNAARSEMQFLIQSKTNRQEHALAQSFLLIRIQQSSQFLRRIPSDDYMEAAKGTVDSYVGWLQELLSGVKADSGVKTETDDLYEQKASLQERQLEALDHLNLDTSKKLEAQIQAVDEKITSLEASAENKLTALQNQKNELEKRIANQPTEEGLKNELASLNAEIANAGTDMSDGSEAGNVLAMKKEAMGYIEEGDTSTSAMEALHTCIDGLGSVLESGSALALSSIKELYQKMTTSSYLSDENAYDDLLKGMEETLENTDVAASLDENLSPDEAVAVIEDVLGISLTADQQGSEKGTNTQTTQSGENASAAASKTEQAFNQEAASGNALTDQTGTGDHTVSDTDQSTVLLALSAYYEETGNEDIKGLLEGQIRKAIEQDKGFAFETYKEQQESFVPAQVVAKYIGYRYLWNDTKKVAILSRGPSYYLFTTFYNSVEREDGNQEYMDREAGYEGTIYLPQSYIRQQFDCQVIDISGADYSVLVNDTVIEKSQELCSELLEKGGN